LTSCFEEKKKMTVEQGIGDSNIDQFPIGMRVLAVDDDPTCLLLLETLLRRCQYTGLSLFFYCFIELFMFFGHGFLFSCSVVKALMFSLFVRFTLLVV
jgi:hypothetical protein